LIAYAKHEFRLARRGEDGVPLRTTLETVARMSGRTPDGLINPNVLHPQVQHVWEWFLVMSSARQNGQPIPESEVGWFFQNRRIEPAGWEPDVIRMLDRAALEGIHSSD